MSDKIKLEDKLRTEIKQEQKVNAEKQKRCRYSLIALILLVVIIGAQLIYSSETYRKMATWDNVVKQSEAVVDIGTKVTKEVAADVSKTVETVYKDTTTYVADQAKTC